MKTIIANVIKALFIIVLASWMIIFVTDYFRARDNKYPMICLSETKKQNEKGEFYSCTSLGYKYFEVKEASGQTTYGFNAAFIKSDIEAEWKD